MTVRLARQFYARSANTVARDLLGKLLVSTVDGERVSGLIVESEAYCDTEKQDMACHGDRANQGRPTARTQVMFGPAGHAYVYLAYGLHWMFNVVTGQEGKANAVLVRALHPLDGQEVMSARRGGRPRGQLTNGPGKLAQALGINKNHDGLDLCADSTPVWIEGGPPISDDRISRGPRIGLGDVPEPWFSIPWRYWLRDNAYVSR